MIDASKKAEEDYDRGPKKAEEDYDRGLEEGRRRL